MWAILSDIHANLEALDAVLADIISQGVEQIICLGDTVGYGPDPIACLDRVRMFDHVLIGNFDLTTYTGDGDGWTSISAWNSILFARQQIAAASTPELFWNFLASRPRMLHIRDVLLVFGSPRNPLYDRLYPEDADNPRKMNAFFRLAPRLTFVGNTHLQGVLHRVNEDEHQWFTPTEGATFPDGPAQKIVNVGSVGQPRDNDTRAAYVLYDGKDIIFRRVVYDLEATCAKIRAIPELDNFLADRLREGR